MKIKLIGEYEDTTKSVVSCDNIEHISEMMDLFETFLLSLGYHPETIERTLKRCECECCCNDDEYECCGDDCEECYDDDDEELNVNT